MKFLQPRALLTVALLALGLSACSGGGTAVQTPTTDRSESIGSGAPGASVLSTSYSLAPTGGRYALPLPQGYDGTITLGSNRAPQGTKLRLGVSGALLDSASGGRMPLTAATTSDPFPILIGFQFPFSGTIPVPGFTIHFPRSLTITGTFDVDWFDPTQPESAGLNPRLLGKAVASGHTLTFTPPPNETLAVVASVPYTLSILRDVGRAYPGGANSVVLPVQPGIQQELSNSDSLGAGALYQASPNAGALLWQTIGGAPLGVAPLIRNDNPLESVVVSATQPLTLTNTVITAEFHAPITIATRASVFASATPAPGVFVPDASPKILGPFAATIGNDKVSFTVPDALTLGGSKAWDFSIVSVIVCVPQNPQRICSNGIPANVRQSVPTNTQFDILVSDVSDFVKTAYGLNVSGPCTTAGINQHGNNGDHPPGYTDTGIGPDTEMEVLATAPSGTCAIAVTVNGTQVASTTVKVGAPSTTTDVTRIPYALRPPVNHTFGLGISGSIH